MTSFNHFITSLLTDAKHSNHRRLVVLSGEQNWAFEQLKEVINLDDCLWLGQGEFPNCIAMSKAQAALGREYNTLVFNAYSGFNPDAFGQSIGTLAGGGLCFIIAPLVNEWPSFPDPDHIRYLASPEQQGQTNQFFIKRLIRLIKQDSDAFIIEQGQPLPLVAHNDLKAAEQRIAKLSHSTEDQAQVVDQILKTISGHRDRPLVITADRGRGKSSALGLAAGQLLINKLNHITVTAPTLKALDSLFKHASELLDGAILTAGKLTWQEKTITFIPPDELVSNLPRCELLLIDEAAAIPTPMLTRLATHYSRLVFSTTVHGYEGTGRGFSLRFLKTLTTISPHWRAIEMQQPIRWAANDPLECLAHAMLGLDSEIVNCDSPLEVDVGALLNIEKISQQQLFENNELLSQMFGLLVSAHYQTKPSDFRQLLDAPNLNIFIATKNNQVVATALVLDEGVITQPLIEQIAQGKRRLRGHLLPQSLVAQLGISAAGSCRYARVMRIAVHPQLQRGGTGATLDKYIGAWASSHQYDYIGASFGATNELAKFWLSQGYQPIRVGLTKDKSSGTHSLMVLKGLESSQCALIQAKEIFAQALRYSLSGELNQLASDLVATLIECIASTPVQSVNERQNIANYVESDRPFEQVDYAINRMIWSAPHLLKGLEPPLLQLVVAKVLQQQPWEQVVGLVGAVGKKQVKTELKHAIRLLNLHH